MKIKNGPQTIREGQKDVLKLIQSCLKLICILLVSYIEDVWFCLQSVWYTGLAKQYRNTLVQMLGKRRYRIAGKVQEKVQDSACWLMEATKKGTTLFRVIPLKILEFTG